MLDLKPEEQDDNIKKQDNNISEKETIIEKKEDYSDLESYLNNILKYLEDEKLKIIKDVEETKFENKFPEKKKKKVSTIEVEEKIEEENLLIKAKETGNENTFIEVKDKIFTLSSY